MEDNGIAEINNEEFTIIIVGAAIDQELVQFIHGSDYFYKGNIILFRLFFEVFRDLKFQLYQY